VIKAYLGKIQLSPPYQKEKILQSPKKFEMEGLHSLHLSQGLKWNKANLGNLYLHNSCPYPIILNLVKIDFLINFWNSFTSLLSNLSLREDSPFWTFVC
jgi:hypothetical protein